MAGRGDARRSLAGVALVFLGLGLTSFGGPVAHVGHFRSELVGKRRWLDEAGYAGWVALCQFLPGPSSTQLAFCLGWSRAGWLGGWMAFLAFMAPSGLLMAALAWALPRWDGGMADGALRGLQVAAWAVVGHAVQGMARAMGRAWTEWAIAGLAGLAAWMAPGGHAAQPWIVLAGALAGALGSRREAWPCWACEAVQMGRWQAAACLGMAACLLAASLAWRGWPGAFYRAGAMVFGGGHVVLPLLEEAVVTPGLCTRDEFLAGYGAAQAMPGPMFTLAAYLGMRVGGWPGALAGLAAIFLPGLLLLSAVAPSWASLARRRWAARAVSGASAAVVGLLGAAWAGVVWPGAIHGWGDLLPGVAAWMALASGRVSPAWIVVACAGWGWMTGMR